MKTTFNFLKHLQILLFIVFFTTSLQVFGQDEETWKDVTIMEFNAPYEEMIISVDGDEIKLVVNNDTKFTQGKKKSIKKEKIFVGTEADIIFYINKRKRVLTKVMIPKSKEKDDEIKGVFELFENDVAYIDGRKVVLTDKARIKCKGSKQCNCSKGRSFLDFDEVPLGSFLEVEGEQTESGVFKASKVIVCQNVYTPNDQKLMAEVSKSFDASGLNMVERVSKNTFNPANGLHEGNIKIGEVNYKLYDDIKVQGYVNLVGNRLLPDYAKEESFENEHNVIFRFYVIENDIPNALAFPNGMIFIYTGLLKLMENEAQLAAVLGHEIAHVTYEHGAQRYKSGKYAGFMKQGIGWVKKQFKKKTNVDENSILGKLSNQVFEYTTPKNIMNIFQKSKETQADRVGLLYMYNAGYDVREAARFWQIMAEKTKNQTFLNQLTNNATVLLESLSDNLDKDALKNVGDEGLNMLTKQLLETIYTSHPRTIKRLGSINELLGTIYEETDFKEYTTGKKDFDKYIKKLR